MLFKILIKTINIIQVNISLIYRYLDNSFDGICWVICKFEKDVKGV
ncbi:MAG: hypothetical protein MR504_04180 [Methanobrevibacter woesei]|nr:hypothetical protein [Methanobrevibacter woesei]MCI7291384.1 hypothetical protein [Methanobrevibacter woesei]